MRPARNALRPAALQWRALFNGPKLVSMNPSIEDKEKTPCPLKNEEKRARSIHSRYRRAVMPVRLRRASGTTLHMRIRPALLHRLLCTDAGATTRVAP